MRDLPVASIPHFHQKRLNTTGNEVCHSIINSITNDEDDWEIPRQRGKHSIITRIANDEDIYAEPHQDDEGVVASTKQSLCKNQPILSLQRDLNNKFNENTIPKPSGPDSFLTTGNNLQKEAFLTRYENMRLEQEKEMNSTISHLRFFFELLTDQQEDFCEYQFDRKERNYLLMEFSIKDLKNVKTKIKNSEKYETVKTDKQFLMVLDILCEDENNSETDFYENQKIEETISWIEILQCYRNCVMGMQALEVIGSHESIRMRTKRRIFHSLSGYKKSSLVQNDYPKTRGLSRLYDTADAQLMLRNIPVKSSRVEHGIQKNIKSKGVNRFFTSIFFGAVIVAILSFGCSTAIQTMAHHEDIPLVSFTSNTNRQLASSGFHYRTRTKLNKTETSENILSDRQISQRVNILQDQVALQQVEDESRRFTKIKSLIKRLFSLRIVRPKDQRS